MDANDDGSRMTRESGCALDLHPRVVGGISLDRARFLDGKAVTVSFIVAKPAYTLLGRTVLGAADRDDDVERGAVLVGGRFDVKEGERLVVRGTLRTISPIRRVSWATLKSAGFEVSTLRGLTHAGWIRASARRTRAARAAGSGTKLLCWRPLARVTAWAGYALGGAECIVAVAKRPA